MRHLRARLLTAFLLVTSVGTFSPRARAEATEAEKRTARDLFLEAYKGQQAGRYAEALEKFEKSLSLFQAPTTLYRIAQCQAALGKWVEAAESYRSAESMPLAENASSAFRDAQANAATERATLEARTPTLTVEVAPREGATVTWSIDGEAFKTGLLGTAIKMNPGSRRIQVSAQGYEPVEQTVVLKDRERRTVRIALVAQASLSVTPPGAHVEPPPRQETLPDAPAPVPTKPEPASPGKLTSTGLLLGIRGGGMYLNGGPSLARGTGDGLFGGFGGIVAGEIGLRFAKVVVISAYLDGGGLRAPEAGALEAFANQNVSFTTTAKTLGFGFMLSLIANPQRPAFYFELGAGSRRNTLTVSRFDSDAGAQTDFNYQFTGPEGTIGAGAWIPVGRSFAVLPKLSFSAGVLNQLECTSTAACPTDEDFIPLGDVWHKSPHTTVMLNFAGFYTLNF